MSQGPTRFDLPAFKNDDPFSFADQGLFGAPDAGGGLNLDNPAFKTALQNLRENSFRQFNAFLPQIASEAASRGFRGGSGAELAATTNLAGRAAGEFSRGATGLIAQERQLAQQRFLEQRRAARQFQLMRIMQEFQRRQRSRGFFNSLIGAGGTILGAGVGSLLGPGGAVAGAQVGRSVAGAGTSGTRGSGPISTSGGEFDPFRELPEFSRGQF